MEQGIGDAVEPTARRDSLEAWIRAWEAADGVDERRELQGCIFDALAEQLTGIVRRFANGNSSGSGIVAAHDIVQDFYVELPRTLTTFLDGGQGSATRSFRAYAATVVRNMASDVLKKRRREREVYERMRDLQPSRLERVPTTPSQAGMRKEHGVLLDRLLGALDPVDQQILREGGSEKKFAELGRELGMPATTVRDRYNKRRALLMSQLRRALGGDP